MNFTEFFQDAEAWVGVGLVLFFGLLFVLKVPGAAGKSLDDRAALDTAELEPAPDAHDRLFEAVMARLEAMEPHRAALIAIGRSEGLAMVGPRLPRTARALLEAAGIDTSGLSGAARVAAMTAVWTRVLVVWRDDEGALNRTMAEIDKQLKQMRRALERIRAGY